MEVDEQNPVTGMSDTELIAVARAKLGELAAHDLRFYMAKYITVTAGGPAPLGDHQATRNHIRQLLQDIEAGKSGQE